MVGERLHDGRTDPNSRSEVPSSVRGACLSATVRLQAAGLIGREPLEAR